MRMALAQQGESDIALTVYRRVELMCRYQQSMGAAYQVAKLIEDNKLVASPSSARL
jgi:hypothetical protein